jgi:GT2 family glycosyltransferase
MAERGSESDRVGAVSAVVCNYNGESYLPACLDALLALEGGLDEIVVVDNASEDGSLALLADRYPSVRVVPMDSNDGPPSARNAGMRAARNRFVLAVDNDAVVRPDLLVKLRAAANARPDAVIVQPRSVFLHEPSRVHYDGGSFHYAGLITLRNFYLPLESAKGTGVVDVDVAVSVCLLMDRDTVLAAGGYDEVYFILFEDLDLSYRMRALGHAILSVEDAIVLHDEGTPGVSFREGKLYPTSRVFYHSRNRWVFLLKCFRLRTLLISLPGLVAYELAWLVFAIAKGGTFAWIRGKWAVLCHLGRLAQDRAAFQRARRLPDRALLIGGPMTVTPALEEGGGARSALAVLDTILRAWWAIVRRLAG